MAYSNFYARFFYFITRIKSAFATIFRFRPSIVYVVLIIMGQISAWTQAWFIRQNLSGDVLVLHYNVDFGIDRVGDPAQIYLYPLLGLAAVIVNFLILAFLHKQKNFKIIAHFLLGAATFFALFLSIALLSVYLINFR